MRRPAVSVLRAAVDHQRMNVSFKAPLPDGMWRPQTTASVQLRSPRPRPELRLVPPLPPAEASPSSMDEAPVEQPVAPPPVRLEPADPLPAFPLVEDDASCLIHIGEVDLSDGEDVRPFNPQPVREKRVKKPARARREVAIFMERRDLKVGYRVVGEYILHVLGFHGAQRLYLDRCVNDRLREDPDAAELSRRELMREEVVRLEDELLDLLRRHAQWLQDETRQGYGVCQFRHGNRDYFVLIDRSGEGDARIVSVLPGSSYRQSVQDRTSPRKTVARSRRPRTQRNGWQSYIDH